MLAAALSFASLVALDVSIMTIMAAGPATFPLDIWGRSLQSTLVRWLLRLGVHRPPCRQGEWAARVELILPWHALTVRLITGIYRPVRLEATAERTGDAGCSNGRAEPWSGISVGCRLAVPCHVK